MMPFAVLLITLAVHHARLLPRPSDLRLSPLTPGRGARPQRMLRRVWPAAMASATKAHSPLMFAALMIGHHFSISAF
jgi:hypothetical protein